MLLEAGHVIDGKYRLVRVIGTGGMGAVYEGENTLIRRRVAIKVLHAASTNSDSVRRFEREAQAAGQIGNDHILEVLDLGSLPNGDRYLVMEYLDGETLAERIERFGRLTPAQIAPLARQFLEALVSAHAAGIIHRDLKPENIFILRSKAGRTDFVKLIDFGISKFSRSFEGNEQRMTRADAVLGTPCYMSPEQARGASKTDVRSDIYSCGVILYEAVTGRLPFEGTSFNDLMFKIALSDAPSPLLAMPDLDPEFAGIINHAIARDPNKRFESAAIFAEAIDAWSAKNGVTEVLAYTPAPSESVARQVIARNAATLTNEEETTSPAISRMQGGAVGGDLRKTGTEESWARSKAEPMPQNPRGSRRRTIAMASAAGLVVVGLAIAVLARPGSVPERTPVAAAGQPPAQAIAITSSASPAPTASAAGTPAPTVSATADAPATSATGQPVVASTAAPQHRDAAKPAAAARPAVQSAAGPAKPKAKSNSLKGFDLGY